MQSMTRAVKLIRMDMAELERRELESRARLMTDHQLATRQRQLENMIRLKGILGEPYDPETIRQGLARCRRHLEAAKAAKV